MKTLIGLSSLLLFLFSSCKDESYQSISDTLVNRNWEIEEEAIYFENGDTVSQQKRTFPIFITEELTAYVDFIQDTVLIQPTADQEYVFWLRPFFAGYDVNKFEVIEWSPNRQEWLHNDVVFRDEKPFSGKRVQFILTEL